MYYLIALAIDLYLGKQNDKSIEEQVGNLYKTEWFGIFFWFWSVFSFIINVFKIYLVVGKGE